MSNDEIKETLQRALVGNDAINIPLKVVVESVEDDPEVEENVRVYCGLSVEYDGEEFVLFTMPFAVARKDVGEISQGDNFGNMIRPIADCDIRDMLIEQFSTKKVEEKGNEPN